MMNRVMPMTGGGQTYGLIRGPHEWAIGEDICPTLMRSMWKDPPVVLDMRAFNQMTFSSYAEGDVAVGLRGVGLGMYGGGSLTLVMDDKKEDVYSTTHGGMLARPLKNKMASLQSTDYKDPPVVNKGLMVRRLTPKECGRLQGFPDDWCEGVQGSDSEQYRMWGNGVALPCVLYIMEGIKEAGDKYNL